MRRPLVSCLLLAGTLFGTRAEADPPKLPDGLPLYAHPTSLGAVAKRFHLRVDDIAALNGIRNPEMFHRSAIVLPLTPQTAKLPRYRAWQPAPARQSCASAAWKPTTTKPKGCERGSCARGPRGEEVCRCTQQHGRATLTVRDDVGPAWKVALGPSAHRDGETDPFEIARADLDGDGRAEILVSWLESESNGIAAQSRTLVVIGGGRELLRYDSGHVVASAAAVLVDGACHLTSAHYEDVVDPIRGGALYLVERSFDPVRFRADAAIVGRRVSDETRFFLPFDPLATSQTRRVATTITGFVAATDEDAAAISLRDASGTTKRPLGAVQLGDATNRRLFPLGLSWPDLVGKQAALTGKTADERTVLWLTP